MTFTPEQTAALAAPLHTQNVKSRSQAGRNLSYIEAWWAIAEANRIFGYDGWTRETVDLIPLSEARMVGDKYRVAYRAKVRITVRTLNSFDNGVSEIVREGCGFGSGIDKDADQAHESALKEAESDAMKRALMTFGNPFGLALYDKTQANVTTAREAPRPAGVITGRELLQEQHEETGKPPSRASLKRSGVYDEIIAEIEACKTEDELIHWDQKNVARCKALPQDWYEAIGDRWTLKREELTSAPPAGSGEMDDAFRNTVGPPGAGDLAGRDGSDRAAA